MRSNLYHVNDLIEQLRAQGYFNLSEVECALLETNGSLTVLPKAEKRPVTMGDLQLKTRPQQMPRALIIDGKIVQENLDRAGLTIPWLDGELKKQGINDHRTVLIAMIDTEGRFYCQAKPQTEKEKQR